MCSLRYILVSPMISYHLISIFAYFLICRSEKVNKKSDGDLQTFSGNDWVITLGSKEKIDELRQDKIENGYRLMSFGNFSRYEEDRHYLIMQKYEGPLFLIGQKKYTKEELEKLVKEYQELDMCLTQVYGEDDGDGGVVFSTYWEEVDGADCELWFSDNSTYSTGIQLENKVSYRLISLTGYSIDNAPEYVGVWKKSNASNKKHEYAYNITLQECLSKDADLSSKGYVAIKFQAFNVGRETFCAGIWDHAPENHHSIEIDDDLQKVYDRMSKTGYLPRQMSHFINSENKLKFVTLWSDLNSSRYPPTPSLWLPYSKAIPVTYLNGTEDLLDSAKLKFIQNRVNFFMRTFNIPGLSIAVVKKEKLKYAAGFGYANVKKREEVTPKHQLRIGSISKPITATTIMKLVEQGKLRLDEKVFEEGSIFGMEFATNGTYGKYVTEITVRHLMQHTAGGWTDGSRSVKEAPYLESKEYAKMVIEKVPLENKPGTKFDYSNFGFFLLGQVIEHISNASYESFVKQHIWSACDVDDIQISRPTLSERGPREVLYYMSNKPGDGLIGDGFPYGLENHEMLTPSRIGPDGGWAASPIELLKFMTRVDGFSAKPDILSATSIKEMTTPSNATLDKNEYGLGMSLNDDGFNGYGHTGAVFSAAAQLIRLDSGVEVAIVVNKLVQDSEFFTAMANLIHHIAHNQEWWNDDKDLFENVD